MKRTIFFWLEKLKITPTERKTVAALMVILVFLGSLNMAVSPSVPFEDEDYLELEKQFHKRSRLLQAKEKKLMKQYYPSAKKQHLVVQTDTVTADSSSKGMEENVTQQAEKAQIDINQADIETLKSLPGIGPTYARRIIEYRTKNGGFSDIEELKKIKGIAQKRLEKLKPFVKLTDSK
jgi:comEA protein